MRIEFEYVPQDFEELRRLASAPRFPSQAAKRRSQIFWIVCVALAVVLFILLQNHENSPTSAPPRSSPPTRSNRIEEVELIVAPFVVILGVVWFVAYRIIRRRYQKLSFESDPELKSKQTLEIGDEGVLVGTSVSRKELAWSAFLDLLENDRLFALRQSAFSYLLIPKRAVPPQEIEGLRELLQRKVQPRPSEESAVRTTVEP